MGTLAAGQRKRRAPTQHYNMEIVRRMKYGMTTSLLLNLFRGAEEAHSRVNRQRDIAG